jgi:hypothetical protein
LGLLPIEWVILRTICEEAGVKQLLFRGEPRALAIGLTPGPPLPKCATFRTPHATPVVPALAPRIAESSGNILETGNELIRKNGP